MTLIDNDTRISARKAAGAERATAIAALLGRTVKALAGAVRGAVRALQVRSERANLMALDDRTLRDIGLSRLDIDVAYGRQGNHPLAANEDKPVRAA